MQLHIKAARKCTGKLYIDSDWRKLQSEFDRASVGRKIDKFKRHRAI
jgi:hypothetical protein